MTNDQKLSDGAELAKLADRLAGSLGPFHFVSRDERDMVVAALRAAFPAQDEDARLAAEIARLREQLASAREALEFIRDGYERSDINHVDFRVGAYKAALSALTDDQHGAVK